MKWHLVCLSGDNIKNVSPFDNKWKTPEKRKTVDDSFANTPIPRLVPLRGSDFTGLGIEVCGGLKEGIFIKKVMPQGPAVNLVNRGQYFYSLFDKSERKLSRFTITITVFQETKLRA